MRASRIGQSRAVPTRTDSEGSALVELALVLPLLLLFSAALLGFGYAFTQVGVIVNAAREGARYGCSHAQDTGGIQARVLEEASGAGLSIDTNDVTVTYPSGGITSGSPIKVTVTHNVAPLVKLGSVSGFSNLTIVRDCTMVIF